jgi:hypothetical protein
MEVDLPDGTIVEFPEGTSPETIKSVLAKHFAKTEAPQYAANGVPMNAAAKAEIIARAKAGTLEDNRTPEQIGAQAGRDAHGEATMRNAPTAFGTFMGNLAPGLTFGFADEIAGGIDAALTDRTYGESVEMLRSREREMADAYPKSAMAGQIAGAVGLPVAAAPRGAGMLRASAQNALTGMGLAGLYGFGAGEGGFINRAENALDAAPLGFALGAASPAVASTLSGVLGGGYNALRGLVDRMRGTGNERAANRAVAGVMRRSGQSPDEIATAIRQATAEAQPEFRLMDATGQAGQRAASTVVRRGDDAAEGLANFLRQRQTDQSTRVPRMIEEAFGAERTAAQTTDSLIARRSAAADTAYAAAREGAAPVNLNDTIALIDDLTKRDPILGESALADTVIGKRLKALRAQMAKGGQQLIDFDTVLNIKTDMFATMEGLRNSRKSVPRQMSDVYDALDAALEASSDMYRAANDGFRAASRTIDAVDEGAATARPGARSQDTVARFGAMNADEQRAARVGYADRLLAQVESNKAITANKAAPFNSTKAAEEARAMTLNPDRFGRQIERENAMWGTMNRALGGSRTADNLMDEALALPTSGPAKQAMVDLFRANLPSAAANLAIAVAPALRGQAPATRRLIADALMSADPETALRAAAQSVRDQSVRRAIERAITAAGAVTVAN